MFKNIFLAVVAGVVPVLLFACVHDVKTESAAGFGLVAGQTWDWVPEEVKTWQQYKHGSEPAATVPDSPDEARALGREHKHIQNSIEDEMSSRGVQRLEGQPPTYYVAYHLSARGVAVTPQDYAPYQSRTQLGDDWDVDEEDTLVIDIVDPATGKSLWTGSGAGNTRFGSDDETRMRGVREAVRHIMKDLK